MVIRSGTVIKTENYDPSSAYHMSDKVYWSHSEKRFVRNTTLKKGKIIKRRGCKVVIGHVSKCPSNIDHLLHIKLTGEFGCAK